MANKLPKDIQAKLKREIYKRADQFNYIEAGRVESGQFIDELVADPKIGKVIAEYRPKERVRTYIKDTFLNAYTKEVKEKDLAVSSPENVVNSAFHVSAEIIQKCKGKQSGLFVLRAESGNIYVVSSGTVLKWETALRKALDIIANEPKLTIKGIAPSICLKLSLSGQTLTEADKSHIIAAVGAVNVKAVFCKG